MSNNRAISGPYNIIGDNCVNNMRHLVFAAQQYEVCVLALIIQVLYIENVGGFIVLSKMPYL